MKELFTKYFKEASSYQSIDPTCFDLQEFTETWLINNKQDVNFAQSSSQLKEKETPTFEEWAISEGYTLTHDGYCYKRDFHIFSIGEVEKEYMKFTSSL